MAIEVRLVDQNYGEFYDPITGVSLRGTDLINGGTVSSGDLTGLDCQNIIKGIADYVVEITTGYLGPVIIEGSVGVSVVYDMLTQANRKIVDVSVICDGAGDIEMEFDADPTGVVVKNGEAFSYTFDIPVETLTIRLDSGAVADYRIVVK